MVVVGFLVVALCVAGGAGAEVSRTVVLSAVVLAACDGSSAFHGKLLRTTSVIPAKKTQRTRLTHRKTSDF